MWKYISRGIRETIEKRFNNFSKKDKCGAQDCNAVSCLQVKLVPGTVCATERKNNRNECNDGSRKEKQQEHRGERWERTSNVENSVAGALGWSGVLVLGWYMCQPLCWRKNRQKLPCNVNQKKLASDVNWCSWGNRLFRRDPESIFRIFSHVVAPNYILPQAHSISTQSSIGAAEDSVGFSIPLDITDEAASEIGPVTAEQALDEAADRLAKAEKSMLSGIENRLGVACMQLGQHNEALGYFHRAVEMDSAPAAFNLGICYETGKGTKQDLRLAAKYYELASKLGHASAMYNLGVFYAHGLGGLTVNYQRARELFTAAADLGEDNARQALSMASENSRLSQDSGYMNVHGNASSEMTSSDPTYEDSLSQSINSDISQKKADILPENCSESFSQSASVFYNLLGNESSEPPREQNLIFPNIFSDFSEAQIKQRERSPISLVC